MSNNYHNKVTKNNIDQPHQAKIDLEKKIYYRFKTNYSNDEHFYNRKISNEIISNETAHIVALFKDYLIADDTSEFFQRYYKLNEAKKKLPKIFDYYISCSVIFPNYVILHEAKYICKNIQRKQRVIDNQQIQEEENEKKKKEIAILDSYSQDNVFDTKVYDSLNNATETNSIIQTAFGGDLNNLNKKLCKDITNEKDESCCKIVSSIEKCENRKSKIIRNLEIKGDLNNIVPEKSKKAKNFFLNNCIVTEGNKIKDKINVLKTKHEIAYNQTPSNFLIKNRHQEINTIPLKNKNNIKLTNHNKKTISMPKLSPRIFNSLSKTKTSIKTVDTNFKQKVNKKEFIMRTIENQKNNKEYSSITSRREGNKPKLNLKAELYDLISSKFRKHSNISKQTLANLSTATPSLSLKTNHHKSQSKQNIGAVLISYPNSQTSRKKTQDLLFDKCHKTHQSGYQNTRNVILNRINNGLFLYDSPSSLTEIFKTTSTRQITFSNDLDKRAEKVIKSFHIKGFDEMLQTTQKRIACHSNRDNAKVSEINNISKSKSKR